MENIFEKPKSIFSYHIRFKEWDIATFRSMQRMSQGISTYRPEFSEVFLTVYLVGLLTVQKDNRPGPRTMFGYSKPLYISRLSQEKEKQQQKRNS